MKKVILILLCVGLCACSPIDSLHPFDQQQAAILLQPHGPTAPSQQMFHFALPQKQTWRKKVFMNQAMGASILLTATSAKATKFHEKIQGRMIPYARAPDLTAVKLMHENIQYYKQHCSSVHTNVMQQTARYVTYRMLGTACENTAKQLQVSKIFNGSDGVYMLRYSADIQHIAKSRQSRLSHVIETAQLVNNPKAHRSG